MVKVSLKGKSMFRKFALITAVALSLGTAVVANPALTEVSAKAASSAKVSPQNFSGSEIDSFLTQMEQYVKLDENEMLVTVNMKAAKKAKVPSEAILVAQKYYEGQNKLFADNSSESAKQQNKKFMKEFEHYFMKKAGDTRKNTNLLSAPSVSEEEYTLDNAPLDYINKQLDKVMKFVKFDSNEIAIFDQQSARAAGIDNKTIQFATEAFERQNQTIQSVEVSAELKSQLSVAKYAYAGCGGGRDNPHACPPRDNLLYRVSVGYAQDWLVDRGYHRTVWYAGGGAPWNDGRDYTKKVSAYNCTGGQFRYQGVLSDGGRNDGYVSVLIQVPEPNPELHTYKAPTAAWAAYVHWWHYEYC
ncbi:hypothetical protein P6P90_16370 [Ectobacillus antri]|uniref:Uncharacterized protein n=1 Tax=Ectobacillus antri TaxID=2486280 RepID=A0ABT6H888_9BACI|nr:MULTISPECIES: hypothetical protein [Ectobacillus]MDG4658448.1 hypothetical protein [Ectobacillus antri]MDG5755473.1 hypothetical protein [Ectobacillus antri]UOY92338.1 hypothetical protein MUG87_18210 [Ectobacillus sp. JY-23]